MIFEIDNIGPKTIAQWYDIRDQIDLSPSYQRSSNAWKIEDRVYLIDSIINGFDLPKFYLADFLGFANGLNESKKRYAVIDGKQRLTAIFDFMEDKFSLDNNFKYINNPEIKIHGMKYSEIQIQYPRTIRNFDGYPITTVGIKTNEQDPIRQMFMRLNRGAPLVTPELRNASDHRSVALARNLAEHKVFKQAVSFGNDRLQHNDIALKILMMEYNEKPVSLLKKDIEKFISESGSEENLERLNLSFERVVTILDEMIKYMKDNANYTKFASVFPVIYWASRQNSDRVSKILSAAELITQLTRSRGQLTEEELDFKRLGRDINSASSILERSQIIENLSKIE